MRRGIVVLVLALVLIATGAIGASAAEKLPSAVGSFGVFGAQYVVSIRATGGVPDAEGYVPAAGLLLFTGAGGNPEMVAVQRARFSEHSCSVKDDDDPRWTWTVYDGGRQANKDMGPDAFSGSFVDPESGTAKSYIVLATSGNVLVMP